MSDLLGSIWWMIVALGVLVTFHEFGHYWVARRCGVKVLRFSVGFGKPLWSRRDRHGTEFALAAIPLGGYVKMLDEAEGEVPASQRDQAFNRKSVWQRIAVVAAGPLANLVLCVALLWAMFVIGRPDYSATLGQVQGIGVVAGQPGGENHAHHHHQGDQQTGHGQWAAADLVSQVGEFFTPLRAVCCAQGYRHFNSPRRYAGRSPGTADRWPCSAVHR